jgi:hypothetical protein
MKALGIALTVASLVVLAGVASAAGFEKGSNLFALQLTEGVADLVDPSGAGGYMGAYDHTELGGQVQFWHFFAEDYALTLSGGIGFFSETDQPGRDAPAGSPDGKYTQSSWQARLGCDRVGRISDRIHLFAGPGVQVWSGKAKFEDINGSFNAESANTLRIAAEGRIGVHVAWNDKVGGFCQLGHYFGRASAEDKGSKTTWWPSGHDGAFGIALKF